MVYRLILLGNGLLGENKKITLTSDFLLVSKIACRVARQRLLTYRPIA